jgi:hypothetical protein
VIVFTSDAPQLDQRCLILPVIDLQAHAVGALDDSAHCAFDDEAGVQGEGHAVSDLELALDFGLLAGWHGKELYAQYRSVFKTLL